MILLEKVRKVYSTKNGEVVAVDNANLEIHEGEIFGVIGYSGAGKSSLIRLLNQLEKPTSGTITINNQQISSIKGNELRAARQEIGMIFQHFNLLWSRTVAENISFPLEIAGIPVTERKNRVAELVKLVGLEGREDSYPSQLSGGQKQRVGIARALANNPKVLLCDEATSALDPETTDSILELLLSINKQMQLTIVLITHEMHVIQKVCNRVAVMEDGKIVEVGDVLDIFKNPQQQITKRFVQQVNNDEDAGPSIEQILELNPSGNIIKLTFSHDSDKKPVVSRAVRQFDVDINIIQGKINQTAKGSFGTLIVDVVGDDVEVKKVIEYIKGQDVEMEVLNHG